MFHIGLQVLKAKIRGFQAAGMTFTSRISKSEKDRKHRLWNDKRTLGVHSRYHMVAYGLLRGLTYDRIERCAENNKLNPEVLLRVMLEHADWQQKKGLNLEKVKSLLTVSTAAAGPVPANRPSSRPTAMAVPRPSLALEKRA